MWFVVTSVTFILMVSMVFVLQGIGLRDSAWVAGEIIVVIIETVAVYWLLSKAVFVQNPEYRPNIKQAFLYSLVANAVSFFGSLVAMIWATSGQGPLF